jgi:hypothetical protein
MDRRGRLVRLTRAPSARLTNLHLLVALLLAFGTGVGAVATGSAAGRWIVVGHGVAAWVVVLLIPWKSAVVRVGVRLHRYGRWPSLLLAALTGLTLCFGLAYATGLVRTVLGEWGMWYHVFFALALVPLLLWHILSRPVRPRRTDLSRRTLLRAGLLGLAAGGLYLAVSTVVGGLGLPGARRRFTGSYETGTDRPEAMPTTIWLDDTVPAIDASTWRLEVVDQRGAYRLGLADLTGGAVTRRATLDCTSGWYAEQDWTGVPVARLIRGGGGPARSLLVHSTTGYWVRIPVRDLDTLLLATRAGGAPLSAGHGGPARLVAPGRRGYWWVKWVDRVELQDTPWWWQPPFPVT